MMRLLLCLAPALMALLAQPALAGDLSMDDVGTYVVIHRDGHDTEMFYRLSRDGERWVMEGKAPGSGWVDVSCTHGCDYHVSPDQAIERYFPAEWRRDLSIDCIENKAQAFCRLVPRNDPGRRGHIIIALVTGQPIPLRIRRVPE